MNREPPQQSDLIKILQKINESLERMNEKLDKVVEMQETSTKRLTSTVNMENLNVLDAITLLSLPDHLRKTAIVVCKLGRATADEVSNETKRARAVESSYLNQLVVMGHMKKERKGRDVYFYIE